ncbi:MAG: hypothetical protein HUJ31_08500 [Pseudomonadales bacterium]|nr:hypothetical protein [Pseudomonadales bacterium]
MFLMLIGVSLNTAAAPAHAGGDALPPGLEKKVERGEPLPPGWQKKLQAGDILPAYIYDRGKVVAPVGDDGILVIDVAGVELRLHERSRKIVAID